MAVLYECIVSDRVELLGHYLELYRGCKRLLLELDAPVGERRRFLQGLDALKAFYGPRDPANAVILSMDLLVSDSLGDCVFSDLEGIRVESHVLRELQSLFS